MELRLFGSSQSIHNRVFILICDAYKIVLMKYESALSFVEARGFAHVCDGYFNN